MEIAIVLVVDAGSRSCKNVVAGHMTRPKRSFFGLHAKLELDCLFHILFLVLRTWIEFVDCVPLCQFFTSMHSGVSSPIFGILFYEL